MVEIVRIELQKRRQQPRKVLGSLQKDDVEIKGKDRSALDNGCQTADEDELHLVAGQYLQYLDELRSGVHS